MKIVIATDSYKGSLTTYQAGNAIADGVRDVFFDADIIVSPIADGGEGTTRAIISATNGELIKVVVTGPLGDKVTAEYGIIPDTKTAIMEMSQAAGITYVDEAFRNPMNTTTYGVGEMILDAIKKGCRNFVIGIGGSATNDGGVGMLKALGYEFLDEYGNQVPLGAKGLGDIKEINSENIENELSECTFSIACDVTNPLCGENGASRIFGPQKGATPQMVEEMDRGLKNFAEITKKILPDSDEAYPGAGAAGGLGFAFMSYLGGKLTSGIDLVIKETGLEEHIKDADFVITGEGRLDGQSYMGKAPVGVAKLAKKYNKPVIAFAGSVTEDAKICNSYGIDAFFSIIKNPCSISDAMDTENAYKNLRDTAYQVSRLIKIKKAL